MIVTFYSYKGGTGRTQLLSNLAAYFCFYQDKKVLMIDWDLEAPGLHYYFKKDKLQHKGLLDLMSHYCDIMQQEITVPEDRIEQEFKEGLSAYIKKDIEKSASGRGRIDLMPAGYYDDTYTRKANHFDWVKFYESLDGGFFIELLKKYLKAQDYDYIFIDSRTGISDYSGICNIQMPDANVVVIAPTDQNVKGCKRVMKRITEAEYVKDQQQRYPIIIPILSRLDPSNNKQRGTWIKKFRTEFRIEIDQLIKLSVNLLPDKEHNEIITDTIIEEYIKTTLIEYQTDISYGEKILFDKEKKDIEITTIEQQFLGIAGFIEAFKNYPSVNFLSLPFSPNRVDELFRQSLKITENEYNTFYYAVFSHDNGDLSMAKKYYEKSLRLTNNEELKYKIQNNLAVILKETNQFNEAEKIYINLLNVENKPDVLLNLANLYFETNKFDKAESYYKEALSHYQKLYNIDSSNLADIAETLTNLGNFYTISNQYEKAEEAYKEALRIRRELARITRNYLPYVATTLNNLANLHSDKNELEEAEQINQEALGIYRQLAQVNPQAYLSGVAITLNNLSLLQRDKNEFEKAETTSEEALEIYRQLAIANPQMYLPEVATTLNNLGILQAKKNQYEKAENTYQRALDIRRQLAIDNPEVYMSDLASTLNSLGILQVDKNNYAKAEEYYREALAAYRELAQNNPKTFLSDVAIILNNLAILQSYKNDYVKAEQYYEKALTIYRELTPTNSSTFLSDMAAISNNLAVLKSGKGDYVRAEQYYEEALLVYRKLAENTNQKFLLNIAGILSNLGNLHTINGKHNKAEEYYEEALTIYRKLANENPQIFLQDIGITLGSLGNLQKRKKSYTKAERSYEEALSIVQKFADLSPEIYLPNLAEIMINMSMFYCYDYPQKEKSVSFAIEVIKIAKRFQNIPIVIEYEGSAIKVLKEWNMTIEDVSKEIDKYPK